MDPLLLGYATEIPFDIAYLGAPPVKLAWSAIVLAVLVTIKGFLGGKRGEGLELKFTHNAPCFMLLGRASASLCDMRILVSHDLVESPGAIRTLNCLAREPLGSMRSPFLINQSICRARQITPGVASTPELVSSCSTANLRGLVHLPLALVGHY